MNLPIATVIRTLRRERNITQEELAAAIGVTYQSVSRWENSQAYPDIELIPKIASFFEISTDVLFGTDRESTNAKREAHIKNINAAQKDKEAFYLACKAAYEDFPDEFSFGLWLCRCYFDFNVRPIKDHLHEVRSICQNIIEKCTNEDTRTEALRMIVISEDEDKIEPWLDMLPSWRSCYEVLLEERYDYHNEVEKCNLQRQKNVRMFLNDIFYNYIGKRDEKRYKDPEASVAGHRLALEIIDTMRDTSTNADAWIETRAFLSLRLAAGCFGAGLKEEGYTALEKAVGLYAEYVSIPEDTDLSYNCPILDLLTVNTLRDADGHMAVKTAYRCLTVPSGWEWFNSVREEERFCEQIARLASCLPEK